MVSCERYAALGPYVGIVVRRAFVTVGGRQVHYRMVGSGPPVVLCHESPLSSAGLVGLAEALAPRFTVLALDTPGYGGSRSLSIERPEISDYADGLAETLSALGVERCGVYGAHTGAYIALELASQHPDRVAVCVADGLQIFTESQRTELLANYLASWPSQVDGSHLLAMWVRYRDQHMFFPWYRRTLETRQDADMPDACHLHEGVMDMLRAGDGYRVAYAAALRYRAEECLPLATVTAVAREGDARWLRELGRLPAGTATVLLPRDRTAWANRIGDLLETAAGAPDRLSERPTTPLRDREPTCSYTDTRFGQLMTRSIDGPSGRPLVMLHPSTSSSAALVPLMTRLAAGRRVIAFDTLGEGDSDKPACAEPWIGYYAEAVAAAIHLGAPLCVWEGDDGPGIRSAVEELGAAYRVLTR